MLSNDSLNRLLNDPDFWQDILRDYNPIELIGKGGFAFVISATEKALDRKVAIKIMRPEHSNTPDIQNRFRREAHTASSLEHPNIVPIYRVGPDSSPPYFTMRYYSRGSLRTEILRGNLMTTQRYSEIFTDICSGLSYAHKHDIIHRDIKPENVMIDDRGRAVIVDFGLARALRETSLTKTGELFVGTPDYMSPEQIIGQKVSHSSDIYSLGAMMYEGVIGQVPFARDNLSAICYAHVHEAPLPPAESNKRISQSLSDLIVDMLAKDAVNRPNAVDSVGSEISSMASIYTKEVESKWFQIINYFGSLREKFSHIQRFVTQSRSVAITCYLLAIGALFVILTFLYGDNVFFTSREKYRRQTHDKIVQAEKSLKEFARQKVMHNATIHSLGYTLESSNLLLDGMRAQVDSTGLVNDRLLENAQKLNKELRQWRKVAQELATQEQTLVLRLDSLRAVRDKIRE